MKLIMEQWRKFINEDAMGFVHQMAKAHQKKGPLDNRRDRPASLGPFLDKQGGREIKQAFNAHADHEFLSTLDTVHWLDDAYGLEDLVGKGKDELSATMTLPGETLRRSQAWIGEIGLWIKGRITLATNDQDNLYSGFHRDYGDSREGDPEAVKHRDKSSGRNKRPSVSKDYSRYDQLEPGNEYMEKMARNIPYILDRSTWNPSQTKTTNEALVDNWSPRALVVGGNLAEVIAVNVKEGRIGAGQVKKVFTMAEKLGIPIVTQDRKPLWKRENA